MPEHLAANRFVRFGGAVSFGWLSNDFGDDGVIGDPTAATARTRRRAVRRRGRRVLRRAREIAAFDVPTPRDRDRWEDLRVDGARLWDRLVELGEIGAIKGPNGEQGCARLALTDADRQGRDLVVSWMRDLGLEIAIDAIGNVVATRPGTDPAAAPVMTGSHIDTVATGGRFDGNLGVLAGLEVIETLEQHGVATTQPIAVAFFTDEEGARFAPDMLGSLVFVGGMALEEALDVDRRRRRCTARRRAGPHRLRRPVPVPDGRRATRLRRAAHRAGSDPRGRGSRRSASSKGCRASRGPS